MAPRRETMIRNEKIMMKKIVRTAVLFFTVMTAAVMGFVVFLNASLPDELYKRQGSPFC